MSTLRFKMVEEAIGRKAVEVKAPAERPAEYFGKYVFDRDKMRKYLPKACFETLMNTMKNGSPLDRETADCVAAGMKQWAQDMGATHYTHWFQPLTGGTAEKHDAFITAPMDNGKVLMSFSGKELIKGEPDASSFPSGGLRATFEARGYTAWDCTSPAFVRHDAAGGTLCIPTAFCSYTGEALDQKTPLLRSMQAINEQSLRLLRLFGNTTSKKVTPSVGPEQEYFLVDAKKFLQRKDLIYTGRTLFGAMPPKGQELDDHYFGSIPTRVIAFMKDLEYECQQLGIPVKTRHNEVAPNQFELAPVFEETNLANDHNQLLMSTMKVVARRHCFRVLLHEKPFKGINGSGKHNNWSLGTDTGVNLLSPGRSAAENLQFITFLVNILMAVYRRNGLLKVSVMSAGNAHRLGANEAPPAILSVFLGTQLSAILDKIEFSQSDEAIQLDKKTGFRMDGITHIPELFRDTTDRNRTSPFAFTGNRFEFRAVGSSDNCADAMITLNTAVAYQLKEFKADIDKLIAEGHTKENAIFTVLKRYTVACKPIRFEGNGYSDEWKAEAARRGLDCETSVPLIFDRLLEQENIRMFGETGVLSEVELHARAEVKWETYTKKVQIEARILGDLAMNHILPVASRYQSMLLDKVSKFMAIFPKEKARVLAEQDLELIEKIARHMTCIQTQVEAMVETRKVINKMGDIREKAIAYHDRIAPTFDEIRAHIDKLELIVDNEMWTLPKYRELLFLR